MLKYFGSYTRRHCAYLVMVYINFWIITNEMERLINSGEKKQKIFI